MTYISLSDLQADLLFLDALIEPLVQPVGPAVLQVSPLSSEASIFIRHLEAGCQVFFFFRILRASNQ